MKMKRSARILFLMPYASLFFVFIVVPVLLAAGLSFSDYNAVEFPSFVGLRNYVNLITQDEVFMQYVLPNTLIFAVIVGPGGYCLAFLLAWLLSQLPKWIRTIIALLIYSPSMTAGAAMILVWRIIFMGNESGILNYLLMQAGLITEPIVWLNNRSTLLWITVIVGLWSNMGVGFLAMLAGLLNVSPELYEAAAIDGVRNRFQEVFYVTIPSMKPQMLFGAVMSICGAFQSGNIGTLLSGANPTPGYSAQMMLNHIEDYGYIRYEMGYAAAVSVALLGLIWFITRFAKRFFAEHD